ncbi:MAG: nucleotide exchange factor GrpE [Flavobacteriales bacterium]|jgi:molecular chaperone GrpE|tara:strand:- start:1169 stop:1744 length:576 start_codon:yes stop_codon:yes gene_type:complete
MSEKEVPSNDELRDDTNIESQEDHVEESSVDTENQEATIDPILKLEEEVKDLKDQNLRLYAEFENFRRRSAKERLELMESANKDTLAALLTILDDFDRALKNTQESEENIAVLEGMKLIQHKLTDTLKNKGLIAMESSVGKAFNVEEMEAITQIPAPTPDMAGKVIDEVEKGYKIGEKVLRYSKVVVGKEA